MQLIADERGRAQILTASLNAQTEALRSENESLKQELERLKLLAPLTQHEKEKEGK